MKKIFLVPIIFLLVVSFGLAIGSTGIVASTIRNGSVSANASFNGNSNASMQVSGGVGTHTASNSNNFEQHNYSLEVRERNSLRYPHFNSCVAEMRARNGEMSKFEAEYICGKKFNITNLSIKLQKPKEIVDCVANLTIKNISYAKAQQECYSEFLNSSNSSIMRRNLTELRKLLNSTKDVKVKSMINAQMSRVKQKIMSAENMSRQRFKHILNSTIYRNERQIKQEIRTMMKSKTTRGLLLSELKSNKSLLMNKTILSAFVPETINLSKAQIVKAEIKDNSSVVVQVRVKAKLFGFIPVPVTETIVNNGNVSVKKPFWAFLAKLD